MPGTYLQKIKCANGSDGPEQNLHITHTWYILTAVPGTATCFVFDPYNLRCLTPVCPRYPANTPT